MTSGMLTSEGRVKGDWPRVEWDRAKTGKLLSRCSEMSLARPDMTTPRHPREMAPALITVRGISEYVNIM